MLQAVLVKGEFENRESVKDHFGTWICEGMYVNESVDFSKSRRQGWVTEVIDENKGFGKIKVRIVRESGKFLDEDSSYVTEFELSTNWCKALAN